MAKCYTYARASSRQQVEDGDSVEHQNTRTLEYYERQLKPKGIEFAKVVEDSGVSAFKVQFDKRPGGRYLIEHLRPGDHVVFDKVDRIWRSLEDFVRLTDWFKRRQINVHICNLQGVSISSDSAMGDFILGLFVQIAQLESSIKRERNLNTAKMRRANGQPTTRAPVGTRIVERQTKYGVRRYLEWDEDALATLKYVHGLHEKGCSYEEISLQVSELVAKKTGKEFKRSWIGKRPFTINMVRLWLKRYRQYRDAGLLESGDAAEAQQVIHQQDREEKQDRLLRRAEQMFATSK